MASKAPPRKRRIAVLGYPAVGKSSLIDVYSEKEFSEQYNTTISSQVTVHRQIGSKDFEIELHDTMGVADLPSFDEGIVQMDGWILVFSVASRDSFRTIEEIYDKLKLDLGETAITPMVIVGNKCDLGSQKREVTREQGIQCAKSKNAMYCESSAKMNEGVADLFEQIVREIETARGEPLPKGRGKKGGGFCAQQ
mmetsp:Transcript_139123/g.196955  ORF Transcript_139123/g.196955 Transcript_139123/m.196955 type:complete len:195 (-) Transcript_139123:141-725(-)